MPEEPAKNFIERLPQIIDREEEDISHLDSRMLEILYPERAPREFTITIVFGPSDEPSYERAVTLAERALRYRREGDGELQRHYATFDVEGVEDLHELFTCVGESPECEILVRDKKVPYARELWLPFFWFFRKEDGRS